MKFVSQTRRSATSHRMTWAAFFVVFGAFIPITLIMSLPDGIRREAQKMSVTRLLAVLSYSPPPPPRETSKRDFSNRIFISSFYVLVYYVRRQATFHIAIPSLVVTKYLLAELVWTST